MVFYQGKNWGYILSKRDIINQIKKLILELARVNNSNIKLIFNVNIKQGEVKGELTEFNI